MRKLIPSKEQLRKWSIPTTYISVIVGIPLAIIFFAIQMRCGATKENQEVMKNDLGELKEMVKNIGKEREQELLAEFPEGFVVFGIIRPGYPLIKGFVDERIVSIDWDTALVSKLTPEEIHITFPFMKVKRENATLILNHCETKLKRQISVIQRTGFGIGDLSLSAEVLADEEIPIVAIGFKANK